MSNGLCARPACSNPVYVTAGGNSSGYCLECRTEHQQVLKQIKAAYDYLEVLKAQHGVCAICHEPPEMGARLFHYDHNHATGKFRGLLCHNCNMMLGFARESVRFLSMAIVYVQDDGFLPESLHKAAKAKQRALHRLQTQRTEVRPSRPYSQPVQQFLQSVVHVGHTKAGILRNGYRSFDEY